MKIKVKGVYTNYELARDRIEFGVFVSRMNHSSISRLVRIVTSIFRGKPARFSHTGFIFRETICDIDEERIVVYEADFKSGMLRKVPASYRFGDKRIEYKIYDLQIPKDRERVIKTKLYFMWGIRYDESDAVTAPFLDSESANAVYCSENVKDLFPLPIDGNLPEDIADYFDGLVIK